MSLPCCAQDMARLGRWMAGKAVGLVLSGGGSRGLAHLGVLHALDTAGVPVDVIGGTSQVLNSARVIRFLHCLQQKPAACSSPC
jgi:hypothetical protein